MSILDQPKVKAKFLNVGRGKRTWEAELKPDAVDILREIRKNGGLMSSDIEIHYEEDTNKGDVFAGFRTVGSFTLEPIAEKAAS